VPGQLYDVDPSRSSELWRVDAEVSGRDPKAFDAGLTPVVDLYLLEVNRRFESWAVLGRTGGEFGEIRFEDLGLDPARRYLVFEFWSRELLGSFTGGFPPGPLPPDRNAQVFIIRERMDRPQIVATSRHITGGGPDLLDVEWEEGTISGRSRVVAGDPYEISFTEPPPLRLLDLECDRAKLLDIRRESGLAIGGCMPERSGEIRWRARFR